MIRQSEVVYGYNLLLKHKYLHTSIPDSITHPVIIQRLFDLFKNITIKKLTKFIYYCNVHLECETEYIYQQLITFADFFCFDLLFTLLEEYTLTLSKGTTFDLLVLYFEFFSLSPIANNYLVKVSHLYRLPKQFVFDLILEEGYTPLRFRKNKLKKSVREQLRSSWYDQPTDDRFNIHCAVCMFGCPATQLCATTECCFAQVHRQCLDKINADTPCAFCGTVPFWHLIYHVQRPMLSTTIVLHKSEFLKYHPDTVQFPDLDHFYLENLFTES